MIITFESTDGQIYIYDTATGKLYENILSADTIIEDEKLVEKARKLTNELLEKNLDKNVEERDDVYDPNLPFSEVNEILEKYYEYRESAQKFREYAEKHYIPTVTRLYKLFDAINNHLTFSVIDPVEGTKSWKISERIKIVKASYDGAGYITPNYTGITPGYWETYSPEIIRDYLETLASKKRKLYNTYKKLAEQYPNEINMKKVEKALETLEIFRKLSK